MPNREYNLTCAAKTSSFLRSKFAVIAATYATGLDLTFTDQ
jgi:hypothetical protein